jgi:PTS system nitrogen regulatory IIA component
VGDRPPARQPITGQGIRQDSAGPHLKALARVSRLLKDKYFRDSLKSVKDHKDIIELVSQEDARNT